MTADEIRKYQNHRLEIGNPFSEVNATRIQLHLLREIAAQLADLNANLTGFAKFTSNGAIDVNVRER